MLEILKSKWFWIALIAIAFGYYTYSLYTENQRLKFEKAVSEQNVAAAKDELIKVRDSVTTLTSYVDDLNVRTKDLTDENRKLKGEIKAWKAKFETAIDSIKVLNKIVGGYTVGDSVEVVTFNGKENIATYDGETQVNVRTKERKLNRLSLNFDIIKTGAEIFLDETDNLYKLRTFSLTNGVTVKGVSTIDEEIFKKLKGVPNSAEERAKIFGVGVIIGNSIIAPGIQIRPTSWEFGAHYILFDNFKTNDNTKLLENWYDRIMISVHYFLF